MLLLVKLPSVLLNLLNVLPLSRDTHSMRLPWGDRDTVCLSKFLFLFLVVVFIIKNKEI
jgi:hypothetical protein